VLAAVGSALVGIIGRFEEAMSLLDRAVELDPTLLLARVWRAAANLGLGETSKAIEDFEFALRISPLDPRAFLAQSGLATAYFMDGRYDDAASRATEALRQHPDYAVPQLTKVASNALAGRIDQARADYGTYQALHPTTRLTNVRQQLHPRREEDWAMLEQGLRLAGMPE